MSKIQMTIWEPDGAKFASGHAGGAKMRHGDWLLAEKARHEAKGVKVEIRRRVGTAGQESALFRV